jgi:ABC-type branched-subunit amino acid transport system substrate-binding protein
MKAQVKILRDSGADAVITAGNYAACAAFIRDAVDAGWQVPIANLSFVGSINFIDLLRAEGRKTGRDYTSRVIKSDVVPNYDAPNFAAGREYLALTAKHHPEPPAFPGLVKTPVVPTPVGFEGFLNAKLLTEVLRRTRGEITGERLREAFKSVDNYDLGIGVPIVFGPSRTQGLDTVYYLRIENGRFVAINDWRAWAP